MWFLEVNGTPLCTMGHPIGCGACAHKTFSEVVESCRRIWGHDPMADLTAVSLDHCRADEDIRDVAPGTLAFKRQMAPAMPIDPKALDAMEQRMRQIPVRTCPRCDTIYHWYPAISRLDNQTEICSLCGTDEALSQWGAYAIPMMNITQGWATRLAQTTGRKHQ